MPEGHSIRRLADQWSELAGMQVRVSSPQGRFENGAALLDGGTVQTADAHGKHLFVPFRLADGGHTTLHVHLGLYGRMEWHDWEGTPTEPTGAVRMRVEYPELEGWGDLRGPTRCELFTDADVEALHNRLGPDPLRPADDIKELVDYIREKPSRGDWTMRSIVMDQSLIAGIGNVYAADLLFRLGISPWRRAADVSDEEWSELWADIRELMRYGVANHGRIVTTRT